MKVDVTVKVLLLLIVILLGTIACQNLLPTSAAKDSPQVTLLGLDRLYAYYPDEKTVYVYTLHTYDVQPDECEWKITPSTPSGPITRTKCQ